MSRVPLPKCFINIRVKADVFPAIGISSEVSKPDIIAKVMEDEAQTVGA